MTKTAVIAPIIADGWSMHGNGSGWWMGGMMIWMVVLWAAVILGVVWLVRAGVEQRPRRDKGAIAILDRRLAEGAISIDEYREHTKVLTGNSLDALESERTKT
jgi:uncharacterized membrane protein